MFIKAFKAHVRNTSHFCYISGCGGAIAVVNIGIPDSMFKRYGNWLSESAKHSYEERLEVSIVKAVFVLYFIKCVYSLFYLGVYRSREIR
jgi:hypothetical protein